MQGIITKFLGPTNNRGSRVKASIESGKSITIPWNHSLDRVENHQEAAKRFCEKMQWSGEIITASIKGGYVHVFVSKNTKLTAIKAGGFSVPKSTVDNEIPF